MNKAISGDQWTLSEAKDVTMEQFWKWSKVDGLDTDMDAYLGVDNCIDFEKEILLELRNSMWKKHWSIFQDHVKFFTMIL